MAGKDDGAKDAASSSDSLGSARANLRETVKWLITSLAALAAGIIAGSPFSGIGTLGGGRLVFALFAGVIALLAIVVAISVALNLLFSEIFYFSAIDKDPNLKNALTNHLEDVLNRGFKDLPDLMKRRLALRGAIAVHDLNVKAGTATQKDADILKEEISRVAAAEQHLTRIAQFEQLVGNIRHEAPKLIGAAIVVMVCFGAFAWAVGKPKGDSEAASAATTTPIEFNPGKGWANIAKALSDRCGEAEPVKVILRGHPMTDWIEFQIASGSTCAGARFTLPATAVVPLAPAPKASAPAPAVTRTSPLPENKAAP